MAREKRTWKRKGPTRRQVGGELASATPRNPFGLARLVPLQPITEATADALAGPLTIEPAWDGHRAIATRVGSEVRLAALDYRDWTQTFTAVARAVARLACESVALDGILCSLDERGAPSFDRLRDQVGRGTAGGAVFIAWDLLWLDGEDLRAEPLAHRRARLAALLADAPPAVTFSRALADHADQLAAILPALGALGIRGVVARATDGAYDASPWHALAADPDAPVDWRRALSPPPPLSNADKVLYPRDGLTKRDIVGYYREVAPIMIPYLLDRPVVIQRWVDGIDEFDWYQHRMPPRAPDYLRAAWVDGVRRVVIENGDALLWMVNQAGLTYHGFASRLAALHEPDFAMIDLDPGDRTTWWHDTIDVALAVRKILDLLELPSVVKTSGQRGLHVLVPLAPGHTFEQCEALGRGIADLLLQLMPDVVTIENEKDKRLGRLLVDHKQFVAKTLVLPYSLRAADGAPVSTPITWDEVSRDLQPRTFTLRTLRDRLARRGDLLAPLLDGRARLDRALAQLRARR